VKIRIRLPCYCYETLLRDDETDDDESETDDEERREEKDMLVG
jgi:hypothetical protein